MDGKTIDDTTAHLLLRRERTRVTDALAQYERAVLAVAEALQTQGPGAVRRLPHIQVPSTTRTVASRVNN